MYRPQIILARNISIEVPRRSSSPAIAEANRDPSRATAIGLNPPFVCTVLGKSIRRRTVASVVAASHCAELQR